VAFFVFFAAAAGAGIIPTYFGQVSTIAGSGRFMSILGGRYTT
jgi:hypothetical protein